MAVLRREKKRVTTAIDMEEPEELSERELNDIALINKLNSGDCTPYEFFNIKMYFGIRNNPDAIRNISDEKKWESDLIKSKLEQNSL